MDRDTWFQYIVKKDYNYDPDGKTLEEFVEELKSYVKSKGYDENDIHITTEMVRIDMPSYGKFTDYDDILRNLNVKFPGFTISEG